MKVLVVLLLVFSSIIGFSQALEKKNVVVDFGWGFPPLNYLSSGSFGFSNSTKTINVGTFVIGGEIFLTDRIGLNATGMYSYSKTEEQLYYVEYNPDNGFSDNVDYIKTTTRNRFKLLVGPNFHLYRSANLDTYLGLGFGMNKSIKNVKYSKQPTDSTLDGIYNFEGIDVFPIAMRISYGLRYFINDVWAFKTEFGLGGPIFNFCLAYKIL